jgi:hypothetical protein
MGVKEGPGVAGIDRVYVLVRKRMKQLIVCQAFVHAGRRKHEEKLIVQFAFHA